MVTRYISKTELADDLAVDCDTLKKVERAATFYNRLNVFYSYKVFFRHRYKQTI